MASARRLAGNSIVVYQRPALGPIDLATDVSGTGAYPSVRPATSPNRWGFFGRRLILKPYTTSGIRLCEGVQWNLHHQGFGAGRRQCRTGNGRSLVRLLRRWKFHHDSARPRTLGTMSRNTFRDIRPSRICGYFAGQDTQVGRALWGFRPSWKSLTF